MFPLGAGRTAKTLLLIINRLNRFIKYPHLSIFFLVPHHWTVRPFGIQSVGLSRPSDHTAPVHQFLAAGPVDVAVVVVLDAEILQHEYLKSTSHAKTMNVPPKSLHGRIFVRSNSYSLLPVLAEASFFR